MKIKLLTISTLIGVCNISIAQYEHCNAILAGGISDITVYKSSDHTRSYKWHSNCGSDYTNSGDTTIASAHGKIFGYGKAGAEYTRTQHLERIKTWCDENEEFALANFDKYEEASVISLPATTAWNRCQEVAKKGVNITYSPMGPYSETVHFTIDSTLDSDLAFLGIAEENYTCTPFIRNKQDGTTVDPDSQPLIMNSNIHVNCKRKKPTNNEKDGVGKITYDFASISINTSGPSLPISFREVVEEYTVTPPKSVLAFDSDTCPAGWYEYKPAYGRFIRGIDNSNQNIDPDNNRKPGDLQSDTIVQHSHNLLEVVSQSHGPGGNGNQGYHQGQYRNYVPNTQGVLENVYSNETRPKNVSLLYCKKE